RSPPRSGSTPTTCTGSCRSWPRPARSSATATGGSRSRSMRRPCPRGPRRPRVRSKFIEVSQGGTGNWGKFMLARFTEEEWARGSALPEAASLRSLLAARGWAPNHLLFVDLETGEGALLAPGGSAPADLEKHRIWV